MKELHLFLAIIYFWQVWIVSYMSQISRYLTTIGLANLTWVWMYSQTCLDSLILKTFVEFFLNNQQQQVGISGNHFFPFIFFVTFIIVKVWWKYNYLIF